MGVTNKLYTNYLSLKEKLLYDRAQQCIIRNKQNKYELERGQQFKM